MSKLLKALAFSLAAATLAAALSGCQTVIEGSAMPTDAAYWQNMQQRLQRLEHVTLSGRLTYRGNGDRFSASFLFSGGSDNTCSLQIFTPFGKEVASLRIEKDGAFLNASGRELHGADAGSLFKEHLGMELPFDELFNIITGRALHDSVFTPQGILYKSRVADFTVEYVDYADYGGLALPKELKITSERESLHLKIRDLTELRHPDLTVAK